MPPVLTPNFSAIVIAHWRQSYGQIGSRKELEKRK